MFQYITPEISARMQELEARESFESKSRVRSPLNKLRQVPPSVGRFLSIIASSSPNGKWLEIGTSGGYSGLWLSLACKARQVKLTTFEHDPSKIQLAHETFSMAYVKDYVNIVEGDVLDHLHRYQDIAFCFLDAEKRLYQECYEIVMQNMVQGGILIADNVISHKVPLKQMLEYVFRDHRSDSVIIPLGKGLLMSRKI